MTTPTLIGIDPGTDERTSYVLPWAQLPAALAPFFRVHAPHLHGVSCRVSTCDAGLLIEPVTIEGGEAKR